MASITTTHRHPHLLRSVLYHLFLINLLLIPSLANAVSTSPGFKTDDGPLWILTLTVVLLSLLLVKTHRQLSSFRKKFDHNIHHRTSALSKANDELSQKVEQHQETEATLASTRNYYLSILNSLPSLIIGIDGQRQVTLWNSVAVTSTGVHAEEAIAKTIFDLIPGLSAYEKHITSAIGDELPTTAEAAVFSLSDRNCYVDLSIHPLPETHTGAVILITDVTRRVEVEQLMVQNEKLLSLGEMAAGLAHEINNPLSAVLNNLQNLQRRTSVELAPNQTAAKITGIDLHNLQDYFAERQIGQFFLGAREAAERAASIVNNILKFSHSGQSAKGPEPINPLIQDVVELENKARFASHASNEYDHKMFVQLNAKQDICECSPPEIQQVVLNLIRNAIQACEANKTNAEINVKTFNEDNYITIEVTDNGPGISEQNLPNVFDPFFTTKGIGEGTGLGLSVSYLIITEHHNGTIEVDSELGRGSKFTIRLPLMA